MSVGSSPWLRHRKRPSTTSTSARTARAVFGAKSSKDLPIPQFVDNYNYHMGQVDQADQLRATNAGFRPIRRGGWHALWHFIFNVTLVNSYLLSGFKDQYKFRTELLYALFQRGTRIPTKYARSLTTDYLELRPTSSHLDKPCGIARHARNLHYQRERDLF
jgi:hypothetical protein